MAHRRRKKKKHCHSIGEPSVVTSKSVVCMGNSRRVFSVKHGVIANVLESKIRSLVSCPCKAIFRGLDDFRAFVDPPYRTETKNLIPGSQGTPI